MGLQYIRYKFVHCRCFILYARMIWGAKEAVCDAFCAVAYASLANIFSMLYIVCIGMAGNERRSLNGFTPQGVRGVQISIASLFQDHNTPNCAYVQNWSYCSSTNLWNCKPILRVLAGWSIDIGLLFVRNTLVSVSSSWHMNIILPVALEENYNYYLCRVCVMQVLLDLTYPLRGGVL